ncbi:MAG: hypothetical protein LBG43_02245 [Treponema sp.]|jgi:hypothetical protein|nr:hypothetical protein [Treponema sp.]
MASADSSAGDASEPLTFRLACNILFRNEEGYGGWFVHAKSEDGKGSVPPRFPIMMREAARK